MYEYGSIPHPAENLEKGIEEMNESKWKVWETFPKMNGKKKEEELPFLRDCILYLHV